MKIGIHLEKDNFSEKWVEYCIINNLTYKIINCYDTNILNDVEDCDAVLWHWDHSNPNSFLFARQLIKSLEKNGKMVFPSIDDCWHYDDKVGQKYLLEAIGAPLIPSYVFYDKNQAIAWVQKTSFPKVFKLKGGYGSNNVKLVRSQRQARKLIGRAFHKGFRQMNGNTLIKNRIWRFRQQPGLRTALNIVKGIVKTLVGTPMDKIHGREKGYVYFQDFMPDNDYDARLIVIGNRCFAIRRYNRSGDFRASGSGLIRYEKELVDERAVRLAFDTATKINSRSIAFDIIYDEKSNPKIVEVSYCYSLTAYDRCEGYWTKDLDWVQGKFNLQFCIIEDLIEALKN